MVEALAESLATKIKQANPNQTASVPVMKFALIIVINFTIPVVASLAFGAVTGKWLETLTAMIFFVALRMISGGYHFESPIPCMSMTFIIIAVPPHISLSEKWTWFLTVTALVLVALLAPANMKGYNTIPEKYYPLLKIGSALIVSSNFLFLSGTAAIVLAVQGISLLFRNKEVNPT
ncbi:MAG: post-translational modification of quorum-sensing peptide protein [Thermobacillus sp.]|jgi:accessory gene regulator B|uniref:accessory gene regulator ArgB-like protein n=1 Tax=Thermobacillus sp. TaxID=2108467 RepID=UPI000E37F373|nr:accessory gene regulator B family protein [Thermobacillus sp.]REJ12513.1 MAG: post-translational modification of quorum-sensing peptide protein [Paenibacillaceae bacterium]REK59256.1 MAG: post-translational modification of quorum-sensing peptide protein [Thermobacillus sp.]